jgi:hypothetical protein
MGRVIGLDVHRDFAQIAVVDTGIVADAGRVECRPDGCGSGLSHCVVMTRWP